MPRYSVCHGAVTFHLPPEWEDCSVYAFLAPPLPQAALPTLAQQTGFRPNLVVVGRATADALDVVAANEQVSAARELPQFRVTQQDPCTAGGLPAIRREYSFLWQGKLPLKGAQLIAKRGEIAYTLTLTTLPSLFRAHQQTLFDALASLEWETQERPTQSQQA